MKNTRPRIAMLLAAIPLLVSLAIASPGPGDTDGKQQFATGINQYLEFRKQQIGAPLRAGNSSEKINSHRVDSYAKLRAARATAKRGDIFSAPISAYFKKQISASLAGSEGKLIRSSLLHAEPVKINLVINGTYPSSIPLQSMPPSLLKNLPQLPRELEYRIVGRALVLRDTGANLIVDLIPDAFPAREGR